MKNVAESGPMLPHGMTKEEKNAVIEFRQRLLDKYPKEIHAVELFGSKARGDFYKESDMDILIIVKQRTPELDDYIIDLVCDILNLKGVYLETVTYTDKEFQEAERLQHPFAINIAREAVVV